MFSRARFPLACFVLSALACTCAQANEALIVKARAYIGSEADLAAVQSLRFRGDLTVVDSSGSPPVTAKLEIAFAKPDRQIITASGSENVETTALDGYEAWQRVENPTDKSQFRVSLLGRDQLKRLRANTFENLSFYRGIERVGGHIEDRGVAKVDGVECHKIAFVHGPDIVFVRSFDRSTGRLILTETDAGTAIREEGEIKSGNLRFPAKIITTNTFADGSTRTITVTFTDVSVNPELPAALFALPTNIP